MKPILLFLLLGLVACSSSKERSGGASEAPLPNEAFKKERPLSSREVPDFYSANVGGALSPALQDETLDRYTPAEVSRISDPADPLLTMAVLCGRGEFGEAFNVASRAFDRYQKLPGYWNQVANCHLNSGNHRKALLFYNKALEVSPDYVPALNNIGVLYSRQGQDQKALVAFERAAKSSRFSKTPRYNLARLYLAYGLADEALPIFRALLSDSPNDVGLLSAVAAAEFILGNFSEAIQTYQRIPTSEWSSLEIGLNFALALEMLNRHEDALKIFEAVEEPSSREQKEYYAAVKGRLGGKK